MKNRYLRAAGLLGAGALLMMAATPGISGQWDGHPEMESSILNELDRPAYMGTGLSEMSPRVQVYNTLAPDGDRTGFAIGAADGEKGHVDLYGSILYDVGTFR